MAAGSKAGAKAATALVWFRQDLRLTDHRPLFEALRRAERVLAVYVLDDAAAGSWAPGGASRWWLHHSLASLDRSLREKGGRLVLRRGAAARIIPELARQAQAREVHCGAGHEPGMRTLEREVAAALAPDGAALQAHRVATLFELERIRTQTGGIYGVYTPFARNCRGLPDPDLPLPAPERVPVPEGDWASDRLEDWSLLPTAPDWAGGLRRTWRVGEAAAAARVSQFLSHHLDGYGGSRNIPGDEDGTSMLSPYLHWGEISPSQIWHAARAAQTPETVQGTARSGFETFQGELLWHEFAAYLLAHHPTLPEQPLRAAFAQLPWRRDPEGLRAWQRGRTGVPIVDAGMRQLWAVGWMHNRVRMIAASFLCKHLLLPWQEGEAWFWDTLVDADLATNSVSWQWVAGCGTDAQPFFRIFNPVTQSKKFDAAGTYIRRWVPELARLPDRFLHAPWEAPGAALAQAGVELGRSYPRPIVDLDEGRRRALAAFRNATARRDGPEIQPAA